MGLWGQGSGCGMTEEFSVYFMAHAVARISYLVELLPSFDDEEEEWP